MKKVTKLLILLIICISSVQVYAQEEKKPKVALVLSGGGAKGIAHIPVLRALDSLGIVPDLIIGTSMGSVVGGLYAMGYSGDSIANIANNARWDKLLGGDISLRNVSVEEKSEFKKFTIELDVIDWSPKLNTSLLRDQNLREFLAELTFPVYDINDFDELSIPFRSMTTDIVNGKEVVLSEGSLGLAMRASMSIPTIFQPVDYKDLLLVDGGVLNNFPVDVAIELGADIVIGSEVGSGMKSKEDLESISTLLFQTSMLVSNMKNEKNKELCDILIDHGPNIIYSTGDFNKSEEILKAGDIATNNNIEKLVRLSNTLKNYQQRVHEVPEVREKIVIDTIIFKGISEENYELARQRTSIQPDKEYTVKEIIEGVNRTLGTRMFQKITYKSIDRGEHIGLELNVFEHSINQLKGSLHYDTYRGVGMILNYTGRNVIGKSSRTIVSIDVAEQPRARLQYQKIFGKDKTWWWRSEAIGELLKQEVFVDGKRIEDVKHNYLQFDNQINKNLNSLRIFVGIGLNYEFTQLKPTVDPDIVDNIFGLKKYNFNNIDLNVHYTYNSLNKVFFGTTGTYFKSNISRSIYNKLYLKETDENLTPVAGNTNGFTKLNLNFEKRLNFSKNVTGIVKAHTNFIFEDPLASDDISFNEYGYAAKYSLGGYLQNNRNNSFMFAGLHEDELVVNQFMKLSVGAQFQPVNKIYIVPHANLASVGFTYFEEYIEDAFWPKGTWTDKIETSTLFSVGSTFSYHSILGPINFDVSYVNEINKFRLYFSVGLLFNSSN